MKASKPYKTQQRQTTFRSLKSDSVSQTCQHPGKLYSMARIRVLTCSAKLTSSEWVFGKSSCKSFNLVGDVQKYVATPDKLLHHIFSSGTVSMADYIERSDLWRQPHSVSSPWPTLPVNRFQSPSIRPVFAASPSFVMPKSFFPKETPAVSHVFTRASNTPSDSVFSVVHKEKQNEFQTDNYLSYIMHQQIYHPEFVTRILLWPPSKNFFKMPWRFLP